MFCGLLVKLLKSAVWLNSKLTNTKLRPKTFLILDFFKIKKIILQFGSEGLLTNWNINDEQFFIQQISFAYPAFQFYRPILRYLGNFYRGQICIKNVLVLVNIRYQNPMFWVLEDIFQMIPINGMGQVRPILHNFWHKIDHCPIGISVPHIFSLWIE